MKNLFIKDLVYRMISRRSNNKEKTMKSMLIHSAIAALTLFAMSLPNIASAQAGETLDTRIGKLSFTHDFANGCPVDAT